MAATAEANQPAKGKGESEHAIVTELFGECATDHDFWTAFPLSSYVQIIS